MPTVITGFALAFARAVGEYGSIVFISGNRPFKTEIAPYLAVVRLEQLYPFPEEELRAALARYPEGAEVLWVQEEPENMGAWAYVDARLAPRLPAPLQLVSRPPSASPAAGSATRHKLEQEQLVREALGEPVSRLARAESRAAAQER